MIPSQYLIWAKLLVIALLCAACGWGGYKLCDDSWQAKEAAQLQSTLKAMAVLQQNAADVGKQLAEANQARTDDAKQHRQELAAWEKKGTVHVECPSVVPGEPVDVSVPQAAVGFGADFIGEWNRGLCLGSVDAAGCNRRLTDGAPLGTDTVAPADLLQNESDNAESCGNDRERLRAWQDLAVKNGWAK